MVKTLIMTPTCVSSDAGILVVGDFFTSIFCGLIIFGILGQMSFQINVPIDDVVDSGNVM